MKEIQLKSNTLWQCIAVMVSVVILACASVFIALEYNKTQWDIANIDNEAIIKSSQISADGERDAGRSIGRGSCLAGGGSSFGC